MSALRGVMGAWLLLAIEIGFFVLQGRKQLNGVWEIQSGVVYLLPMWLCLASLPGLAGGLSGDCFLRVADGSKGARISIVFGVALFGGLAAWSVGGGRHLAGFGTRASFALLVSVCGAGVAFIVLPRLSRWLLQGGGGTPGWLRFVAGGLAPIFGLELLNNFILVRLYPAFHAALSFLSFCMAGACGAAVVRNGWGGRRGMIGPIATVAALVAAVIFALPASRAVAGFDNFRWTVSERSPSLAWGVEWASKIAPPLPIDTRLAALPLGERRSTGALDLAGRDILLVSIDALRADHVGAYGYRRDTTPELDQLAQSATVFEAAYAPTPHTSYSITSLMTGKYMRPLLLQGAGQDSDLWANVLQTYEYRTAAFYPPAVFFIDPARFTRFESQRLGFEYSKVEFAEGEQRVAQVAAYLERIEKDRRVFTWVHLFGPHEPYEAQPGFDFGSRDIDLYDSEVKGADKTLGRLVKLVRDRDPRVVVIVTADHGEEFGDHGGRYHGSSVYDEQVRVPLLIDIPGVTRGRRVHEPVQTIDLLPTVLSGLSIPIPPRMRGRDLARAIALGEGGEGFASAETDQYTLLAEHNLRLICHRRSGACQLYDVIKDPGQKNDLSKERPEALNRLRERARAFAESHGKYESQGLRAEGKGWPGSILLGVSGNAEAAPGLAQLLDDADPAIRRKAAELLFELATEGEAAALRLAMTREEDEETRAWLALSLTRLGKGAPLVHELLLGADATLRRRAALALAESGDNRGETELIAWWQARRDEDHEMVKRVLRALVQIRSKKSVPFLIESLKDVRLRPHVAQALGELGDKDARPHLAMKLAEERYRSARKPLFDAIIQLGGKEELIVPLRRFLGVPERVEGGLALALRAGILNEVGGPKELERRRLAQLSDSGVHVSVVVPPGPSQSHARLIVRARSRSGRGGQILVQSAPPRIHSKKGELTFRKQPEISRVNSVSISIHPSPGGDSESGFEEIAVRLPPGFGAKPGQYLGLDIFAPTDIELSALAVVPEREDLPPPPPEPWSKGGVGDEAGQEPTFPRDVSQ
jgi:arylsulfatase A-like enzyme